MSENISPKKHGEDWELKFNKITELAVELFLKDGENMSMRELAKKMGIAVGGLYRYVQDRRDMFFLCQNHVMAKMSGDFESITIKERGDVIATLTSISNYLLDLAEFDYPRFRFMFLLEPPQSTKTQGEHEEVCQRLGIEGVQNLLMLGIQQGIFKITEDQVKLYIKVLWGFILGPGALISPMYDYFFFDEDKDWKKRFRDEVIKITLQAISN